MFPVWRRSHESDRAASLLEAVRSYVGVGTAACDQNNFNNLDKENSNLGPGRPLPGAVVTGTTMIRTVSTLNLRNGFVVEKNNNNNNNNEKPAETLDPSSESADTDDVSQNSLNSSENAG